MNRTFSSQTQEINRDLHEFSVVLYKGSVRLYWNLELSKMGIIVSSRGERLLEKLVELHPICSRSAQNTVLLHGRLYGAEYVFI